jgi:redox-sensitive bicupin YhaK (pirin superfamily)
MYERTVRQNYNPGDFTQRPNSAKRLIIPPGNWEAADPFLLMAEDFFHTPEGFPDHPHRGIETVTFVLGGELRHADNRGNSGVLGAMDVQWMTAGGGIIHAELPHQESTVHSLQLWLNMPSDRKLIEPGYQDLHGAEGVIASDDGVSVRVLSGSVDGVEASTVNVVPVLYLEVTMEAGKRITLPVPAAYNGFVHVIEVRFKPAPKVRPATPATSSGSITRSTRAASQRWRSRRKHAPASSSSPAGRSASPSSPTARSS